MAAFLHKYFIKLFYYNKFLPFYSIFFFLYENLHVSTNNEKDSFQCLLLFNNFMSCHVMSKIVNFDAFELMHSGNTVTEIEFIFGKIKFIFFSLSSFNMITSIVFVFFFLETANARN